jgi:hypothetical protein
MRKVGNGCVEYQKVLKVDDETRGWWDVFAARASPGLMRFWQEFVSRQNVIATGHPSYRQPLRQHEI